MEINKYDGHLDHCNDGLIFGWVCDRQNLNHKLTVILTLSSGWKVEVYANRFRDDLLRDGIGDGCYGFDVTVPFGVSGPGPVTVEARVDGTGYFLSKSGRFLTPEYPIMLIAGDIVDNCNLRCPFCVTDYAKIRGTKLMAKEIFLKLHELLPLVPDGMFWLSCMHEATLHPEFLDFIESIPSDFRKKVSFTTNLCKKMDDAYLGRLASTNIHSIRISIDSFDSQLFSELRKGGRLETFTRNLTNFSSFLQRSESKIEIHMVTMAFKSNLNEIEALIEKCRQIIKPSRHEIRFMFYVPHASEWGEERILSLGDWERLKDEIGSKKDLGLVEFFDPEKGVHQKFLEKPGLEEYESPVAVFGGMSDPRSYKRNDPLTNGSEVPDEPLRLRLRWDGLVVMEKLPESQFAQNVLDVDKDYFLRLRDYGRKIVHYWVHSNVR